MTAQRGLFEHAADLDRQADELKAQAKLLVYVMDRSKKPRRRSMSAVEHRERAQRYRTRAALHLGPTRQELMLAAIKHEAIAEELDGLDDPEGKAGLA